MGLFVDRTGQRYGRLLVLSRAENIGQFTAWLCRCDCGAEKVVMAGHLQQGRIVSCGCWKDENSKLRATRHGKWGSKLHKIWLSMRQRCNNSKCKDYINYGSRGIRVCTGWNDFATFENWAFTNGYTEGLSIERKNNDGDYCPENCTWIPRSEQQKNTRRTLNNRVPIGTGSIEHVTAVMSKPLSWAPGLPLRAAGFECDFYMKD